MTRSFRMRVSCISRYALINDYAPRRNKYRHYREKIARAALPPRREEGANGIAPVTVVSQRYSDCRARNREGEKDFRNFAAFLIRAARM